MPCAVRLALAILQEQGDQPVAVVLAYAAADDDVRLVGIGGLQGEQSFREPQAHGSTCCTRRHSRLPSVSSRVGGVELVRLQHLAPGREATQRVAVDEVLGGELLVVTAERAVQVGQHEPLQLVTDLPFPGYVEHCLFDHATNRSRPVRPHSAGPHFVHAVSASRAQER